ncbi:hypothetical protein ABZP36_014464 [Zizania latifolia]
MCKRIYTTGLGDEICLRKRSCRLLLCTVLCGVPPNAKCSGTPPLICLRKPPRFSDPTAVAPRRRAPSPVDADAASSSGGPCDDDPPPSCDGRAGAGVGASKEEAGGVGPYEQARKALSLCSPFDGEEAAGRDALLPARVAKWVALGDV